MKPAAFEYCRPDTLEEALAVLGDFGADGVILAGGLSLGALLNTRLVRPAAVIDINRIAGLDRVEPTEDALFTGPLVRQADALIASRIEHSVPLLAAALPNVGHYQTRSRGTLAGSVAHADPSAEIPLCLAVLGGEVELSSTRGRRRLAVRDFIQGALENAREADEMVTGLIWPTTTAPTGVAFTEVSERHGDFAIVAAAAWVRRSDDDGTYHYAFGLGGVEVRPRVATGSASLAPGDRAGLAAEAAHDLARRIEPMHDPRASAAYRRHLAGHLAAEVLNQAFERAGAEVEA